MIERELALGYQVNDTAAPGLTHLDRHKITGSCIDANTAHFLYAICKALYFAKPHTAAAVQCIQPSAQLTQHKLLAKYGKGLTMMRQHGWRPGQPLGCNQSGHITPNTSKAVNRRRAGLGHPLAPKCLGGEVGTPKTITSNHKTNKTASVRNFSGKLSSHATVLHPVSVNAGEAITPSSEQQKDVNSTAHLDLPTTIMQTTEWVETAEGEVTEIWDDQNTLYYVAERAYKQHWDVNEKQRVQKRSKQYLFFNSTLYRLMSDGSVRMIPKPAVRAELIKRTHEWTGHWGEKRTLSLLCNNHWWRGMSTQVREHVRNCPECDRSKATFNVRTPQLQPLPIGGMFYRWGVDLFGPVEVSKYGNRYVMVAIEHYGKHIELVPIPSKKAIHTRHAFLQHVLSKFGACAEVITDGGTEFKGEFDQLMQECMIDHRRTAPNHPQADGLAERAVRSVKAALGKMCESLKG